MLGLTGHHEAEELGRILGVVELEVISQLTVPLLGLFLDQNGEVEGVLDR